MSTGIPTIVALYLAVLPVAGLAQTAPDKPAESVRITGRVVFPESGPVSAYVRVERIEPDGFLTNEKTALTDSHGVFTFLATPHEKYRLDLDVYGVRTRTTVDTTSGKDVDVGDLIFEKCPPVNFSIPKAPTSQPQLVGDLTLDEIVIEPQQPVNGPGRGIAAPEPPATQGPGPNHLVGLPPCWSWPSLDNRVDWEALPDIMFDRYLSIESFIGGKVKLIRVVRYDPKATPSQIRDGVRKAWFGIFWHATSAITWAEITFWNIEASVEYEDGERSSFLTDGGHVRVQDREGKYWFIRLWPAVD